MSGNGSQQNLESRLSTYWTEHPNAVMTLERICIDFGVSRGYAKDTLRRMHYRGTATSTRVYLPTSTRTPAPGELEVRP
jgi:phage terminase large subunit GpA-like protein